MQLNSRMNIVVFKKVLKSIMIITFAGTLVGGTTFALWTTTATVENNTMTSGNLTVSVSRDNGDAYPGPMFYTNNSNGTGQQEDGNVYGPISGQNATGLWYPGKTKRRYLYVKNTNPTNSGVQIQPSAIHSI